MTIKEAILKSMEDLGGLVTHNDVTKHIIANKYRDFKDAKTPKDTVSAYLGDFIRTGDTRVKRIKQKGGTYTYYLTKNESLIDQQLLTAESTLEKKIISKKDYRERSLHFLLSSYLRSLGIFSKTIFHEQSNGKDKNQVWTHPDMVGVDFLKLKNIYSQSLLKAINKADLFKLRAYEIKKEINSDNDLKQAYFQAVSNSSWANYGYLVAFKFGDALAEEMNRLNDSFGIGIIQLKPNPYQSKVLYPARYKEIDFKTLDKMCEMNTEFGRFTHQCQKLLTAPKEYLSAIEREFEGYCDSFLKTDSEAEDYCKEHNIPLEDKES